MSAPTAPRRPVPGHMPPRDSTWRTFIMANATRPQVLSQRRPLAALAWRLRSWVRVRDHELLLLLALMAVGMLAQGLNMFNYPAFKDDEAIYSGQAWAVLRQGR